VLDTLTTRCQVSFGYDGQSPDTDNFPVIVSMDGAIKLVDHITGRKLGKWIL
jgi:hypothetical protein